MCGHICCYLAKICEQNPVIPVYDQHVSHEGGKDHHMFKLVTNQQKVAWIKTVFCVSCALYLYISIELYKWYWLMWLNRKTDNFVNAQTATREIN